MRELGVPKGVYTSTLAVNSDTRGALVDETFASRPAHLGLRRTKAEAHKIAKQFIGEGLPLVIVQPGLIYGPGDTSSVGTMFRRYLQRSCPSCPPSAAFLGIRR